ncbi:alginate O-acetyltransferase [Pseudomonas citronellolis]|uniref:alginate O-acetyltransferase n=1 Tax=Pseudomonas citronellolis TaxID=53408 RepID=UPI0023E3B379|nr:alginate O-acetyltransferase [Pseudomonas citronellolis]MDF3932609.1 alginate O-acetyltransferase [Pseudomonas citronellolis]
MFPVMKSASKLNGILFIALMAAMFVYSLPAVFGFAKGQTEALGLFLDGKLLRRFEKVYDKRFFLREPSVRLWADARFMLFGEGSSGVVLGNDGWLFTNQEYLVPTDLPHNLDQQVQRIVDVQRRLREHGKELILLPLPMKVDVYAEHARRQPDPRALGLYDSFTAELGQRGVKVSPIRAPFLAQRDASELFVPNDTHWSPAGARLAAASFAAQQPQLVGGLAYRSQQVGEKEHKGDLLNYMLFSPDLAPQEFHLARLPVYETLRQQQPVSDDNLFGEQDPSILLVGTSYSKIDDWNFVGFLKEALQTDLVSIAVEARGPFQAMDEFLAGKELQDQAIQTVIWEFPLRTLLAQREGSSLVADDQPHHF